MARANLCPRRWAYGRPLSTLPPFPSGVATEILRTRRAFADQIVDLANDLRLDFQGLVVRPRAIRHWPRSCGGSEGPLLAAIEQLIRSGRSRATMPCGHVLPQPARRATLYVAPRLDLRHRKSNQRRLHLTRPKRFYPRRVQRASTNRQGSLPGRTATRAARVAFQPLVVPAIKACHAIRGSSV